MSNNKIPITDLLDNEDVFKDTKKPRKSDKKLDITITLLVIIAIIAIVRTVLYFKTALVPINDSVIISYSSSSSELASVSSKAQAISSEAQTVSSENSTSSEAEIEIVNINTADKDKLCTLHSIGESRALAIIAYRETNGYFQTIDDIKNVKGIGEKIFEGIKDNICV